jgi:hypothetical protein
MFKARTLNVGGVDFIEKFPSIKQVNLVAEGMKDLSPFSTFEQLVGAMPLWLDGDFSKLDEETLSFREVNESAMDFFYGTRLTVKE